MDTLRVLQIGTLDCKGGAAQISWHLHNFLRAQNIDSKMYVGYKYSDDKDVISFYPAYLGKWNYYKSAILANDISFFNTKKLFDSDVYKQADIVHLHNLHGAFFNLSALKKISKEKKVVWTFHDMWPVTAHCAHTFSEDIQNGFFVCPNLRTYSRILWNNTKFLEKKKRNVYQNSNFDITVPSQWMSNVAKKSLLKNKNIQIIPNGIDTKIFERYLETEKIRSEFNIPIDKNVILFMADGGIDNKWKGGQFFEQIVKYYGSDSSKFFVCIGDEKKRKVEKNILYIPFVKDKVELAKYYSVADVFLYPSLADSFGLVVAEAMSCGLPVVAFDVGGITDLVNHKVHGYLSTYQDTQDLIRGIEYITSMDDQTRREMRKKSIKKIRKNFSLENMLKNYLNLYKQLNYEK